MWGTDTAGDCPDIRMPTVYSMMRYIVAVRIAGISGDRYASGGSVGTRRREVGAVLTRLRGRIEQIKPSAASGDPAGQAAAFAARRQGIEVPVGSIGVETEGEGRAKTARVHIAYRVGEPRVTAGTTSARAGGRCPPGCRPGRTGTRA